MANPQVAPQVAPPTGPTPASAWKRDTGEELPLPSGNVAMVRRPGMEKLFAAGVLPDGLTAIALEAIDAAETGGMKKPQDHQQKKAKTQEIDLDPAMMKKFLKQEGALQDLFASFDKITELCVVQPPVRYHMRKELDEAGNWVVDDKNRPQWVEIPFQERDNENFVYTDEVSSDDKTFIFNFVVGGTRDIEQFREEYGDALATVQPREDVELPPE